MYVLMWFRISVEFLERGSVVDIKVIQRENIYWDESNEFELTRLFWYVITLTFTSVDIKCGDIYVSYLSYLKQNYNNLSIIVHKKYFQQKQSQQNQHIYNPLR